MGSLAQMRPVTGLRPDQAKTLKPAPVSAPPSIAWLQLTQLVIDDSYQRSLSEKSLRSIRRMAGNWDWSLFKPLSVSPVDDGLYEILDGQHEAIAAATTGLIQTLPCMILPLGARADRAAAFVGINHHRLGLTAWALYRARLAAEDPEAVAVDEALALAGCELFETYRYQVDYAPGAVGCVNTLCLIARRRGATGLARILSIAKRAGVAPMPSPLLKGVEALLCDDGGKPLTYDDQLVDALATEDVDTLTEQVRAYSKTTGVGAIEGWTSILRNRVTPPPLSRWWWSPPMQREGSVMRRAA
jgi:hypothetical protein